MNENIYRIILILITVLNTIAFFYHDRKIKHLKELGVQGPQGMMGPQGPMGEGVPFGGKKGQVLVKKSNKDFDTEWRDYGKN